MTETLLPALVWFAAGALIGSLYWLTLRWTAEMFASGRSLARVLGMQVIRFAALGAIFVGVAIRGGALALLVSAGGVMVARAVVLRRSERE